VSQFIDSSIPEFEFEKFSVVILVFLKYEGYSKSNLRLFLATNVGAGESSHMRGSVS
jgi:hypothetical protein